MIAGGGVRYPTKVEVSFRKRHGADQAVLEAPSSTLLDAYSLDPFEMRHYVREAAVRQKIEALGGRREAQARDVFDIQVLVPEDPPAALIDFVARALRRDRLEEAHARTLAISYSEYQGQVSEFLAGEARSHCATETMWDEMRLRVASLIEAALTGQERE